MIWPDGKMRDPRNWVQLESEDFFSLIRLRGSKCFGPPDTGGPFL
jgi:hypothetical protein